MNLSSMLLPYAIAVAAAIVFRYARPLKGQTHAFVLFSSLTGAGVGTFGALLIGGAKMADNVWWLYLGCTVIAFVLTIRIQALAVSWLRSNPEID